MKSNVYLLISMIFGLNSFMSLGQEIDVEDLMLDCKLKSYNDGGSAYLKLISDYEVLLINEGFLENNTSKSYQNLLFSLSSNGFPERLPSAFYFIEAQKGPFSDTQKYLQCSKSVMNTSDFESSKMNRLVVESSNSFDGVMETMAGLLYEIFESKDFNNPIVKSLVFSLFSFIDVDSGIESSLPKIQEQNNSIESNPKFKIYLDSNEKIKIGTDAVNLSEMQIRLNEFLETDNRISYITIKVDRQVSYKLYVKVYEIISEGINFIYNQMANKLFSKQYSELTNEQVDIIKSNRSIVILEE